MKEVPMTHEAQAGVKPMNGVVLGLLSLALLSPSAHSAESELRMRAFAVDMNRGRTRTLTVEIARWTTDAERKRLHDTLVEQPDKLLQAVQSIEPRVGFIRGESGIGWDIRYARHETLPSGGQRVVFATDRPMSFFEAANSPRSKDYEYLVGEIRLGPDGKGAGKLATTAKVRYNNEARTIEVENYDIEPIRLSQVVVEESRHKATTTR
jgi:hypothetical protein